MKKEKDGKVVTDEENSSQENKEHVAPSQDTGLTRRDVLKKAAWMVPVILSTQLSGKIFAADTLSCIKPGDVRNEECPCDLRIDVCDWWNDSCYCEGAWWDVI